MFIRALMLLKKLFDSKRSEIICIVIAILNKSIIALLYSSLKADKALYLLFAKTFLETGKLAEAVHVFETGRITYLFDPAIHSPLYSLLCVPFLGITKSYFITQFIVSFLGWIVFFTALYKIACLLFQQRWITNLFVLWSGFFLYPHELISGPKDTLAAGLTLWSVFLVYQFITARPHWRTTVFLAITLSGLALTKMLYLPLVALLVCILFISIFLKREKSYISQVALLAGMLLLIGFVVNTFVFQPAHQLAANNAVSLPMSSTPIVHGFYPQNLLYTFPFISSSFINTQLWAVQVEKLAGFSFGKVMKLFFSLDVLFFVGLLLLCSVFYKKITSNKILSLLFVVSLTIIGAVMCLSLTEKALVYHVSLGSWTYVSDARSFLVAMLTLQLLAFGFIFMYPKLRYIRYILISLFFLAVSHGFYFTVKNIITFPATLEANTSNDAISQITTILKQKAGTGNAPMLVTSDRALRRYAQILKLPVASFTNLSADLSWMNKGDNFLIATYQGDTIHLKKFLQEQLVLLDTIPPFVLHTFIAK